MTQPRISYITRSDTDVATVEEGLAGVNYEMTVYVCASPGETIEAMAAAVDTALYRNRA